MLLGGETSYERRGGPDDPMPLLFYLSSFLLTREDQDDIKKPVLFLLIATVAIRAWFTSSTSSGTKINDISPFIMEIKHQAETVLKMIQKDRKSKAPVLFKMICNLPRQMNSPPVTFLQKAASNLLHGKPECSNRGGLANTDVCRAIANEINRRRHAELDLIPSITMNNGSKSGMIHI